MQGTQGPAPSYPQIPDKQISNNRYQNFFLQTICPLLPYCTCSPIPVQFLRSSHFIDMKYNGLYPLTLALISESSFLTLDLSLIVVTNIGTALRVYTVRIRSNSTFTTVLWDRRLYCLSIIYLRGSDKINNLSKVVKNY